MDISWLVRIKLGTQPEPVPDAPPLDPREVDRLCRDLRWPEDYCASWMAFAAGIHEDADGHPMTWTLRQVRGLLFMRELHRSGRLDRPIDEPQEPAV